MWAGFQTAVRLIYPPRCLGCGEMVEGEFGLCKVCWGDTGFIAGTVCEACGTPLIGASDGFRIECDDCMAGPRPWRAGRAALIYADRARSLVLALKHGDRPEIARAGGLWMARAAEPVLETDMIVTPVPLHWSRMVNRKYNQSALLGQVLAEAKDLEFCPDLLVRNRKTPKLDQIGPGERAAVLKGAIHPRPCRTNRMADRHVLLVDDVMTSGATLEACTQACFVGGARSVAVTVLARKCRIDPN